MLILLILSPLRLPFRHLGTRRNRRPKPGHLKQWRRRRQWRQESELNSSVEELETPELHDEEPQLKAEEEIQEKPETPISQAKTLKSKVFNVALDPITSDAPQFAQVLIPVPMNDDQKKRLISFLQTL